MEKMTIDENALKAVESSIDMRDDILNIKYIIEAYEAAKEPVSVVRDRLFEAFKLALTSKKGVDIYLDYMSQPTFDRAAHQLAEIAMTAIEPPQTEGNKS